MGPIRLSPTVLGKLHPGIAYLGVTAGWQTVDAAIAEPALLKFVERLWDEEIIPGFPDSQRLQARTYTGSLLERFRNTSVAHQTAQIAIDGSKRIPLRWLPSLRVRLANDQSIDHLSLCVAAWIHFLGAQSDDGGAYVINDPQGARLQALLQSGSSTDQVWALLAEASIFAELGESQRLRASVVRSLNALRAYGTLAVLQFH